MATFPDIIVDPFLVCLPRDCDEQEQLDQFVENLLAWSGLLRRKDIVVLFADSCLATLLNDGFYPYGYELKKIAVRLGATHLPIDFVCQVAQTLLDRTPKLEEHCSINIVVFDEPSYSFQPEVYLTRLGAKIGWEFKHGLIVVACFLRKHPDHTGFLLASAMSAPREVFQDQEVEISAHVEAIDSPLDAEWWSKLLPSDVNQELPVVFSRDAVFEHIGSLELWGSAESSEHAAEAIATRIRELLALGLGDESKVKDFYFGAEFLDSVRKNAFAARADLATNLIDSCAKIVLGAPKNSVEPFREDERPTSSQRTRGDGALAWRTHLTKRGAGFRLMFWELTSGGIELANVGTKSELKIG